MITDIQLETPPLRVDADGAVRIGASQVLLEIVAREFRAGATPEEIVQRYPTAALADVYATIAFILAHPDATDEYLAHREAAAAAVRQQIEGHQGDLADIRQRLVAKQPA